MSTKKTADRHADLVATTTRIAAFATLELNTPQREELTCESGVHFIVLCVDMDGGRGWDCRSTFCTVHVAKMLRAMANAVEERAKNTEK